jgi:predicted negative regulator of RcsB-dependent stress response
VDTFRTEEEQVEALRRWWDDNGRSTLIAIVIALAASFGWQGWKQHQVQQAESASIRYEELLEATQQSGDESQLTTIRHLAEELKSSYSGSVYAQFASLHLARMAVMENDLESAEHELRGVLTMNPPAEVRVLAELRLARVVAARGNPQGGMEILNTAEVGAYEPAYAEARGDMYVQMGQAELAVQAYENALGLAAAAGVGASESLQLKLQSLTPVPAREVQPDVAPVVETEMVPEE